MSEAAQALPPEADQAWSILYNGSTHGPYNRKDLLKLILSKQLNAKAQLKRADWQSFRSILDCLEILALDPSSQKAQAAKDRMERRIAAPRATVNGLVQMSKEGSSIFSIGHNISTTGIFVKTGETKFRIGEMVSLQAKINEIAKPFKATAEIMRFSTNIKFGVGYGMRFVDIDNLTVAEIAKLVGVRPIAEFGEIYSSPKLIAPNSK
jgi:hypothetical protein